MIKLYTSNFAKMRSMPDDIKFIAISCTVPKGIKISKLNGLAPRYGLVLDFKSDKNKDIYIEEYQHQLSEYSQEDLFNMLERDTCFLCYERASGDVDEISFEDSEGNFCHRHIFADWMRKGGYEIEEWNK